MHWRRSGVGDEAAAAAAALASTSAEAVVEAAAASRAGSRRRSWRCADGGRTLVSSRFQLNPPMVADEAMTPSCSSEAGTRATRPLPSHTSRQV